MTPVDLYRAALLVDRHYTGTDAQACVRHVLCVAEHRGWTEAENGLIRRLLAGRLANTSSRQRLYRAENVNEGDLADVWPVRLSDLRDEALDHVIEPLLDHDDVAQRCQHVDVFEFLADLCPAWDWLMFDIDDLIAAVM